MKYPWLGIMYEKSLVKQTLASLDWGHGLMTAPAAGIVLIWTQTNKMSL